MLSKIKQNKNELLFYGLFFIFAVFLIYLFPYSGDDWAWGSEIGLNRLNNWFEAYNGRYAGNLLVILLTRTRIFDAICIALNLTFICFLSKRIFTNKYNLPLLLSGLLIITVSTDVFAQSFVWTAGFTNYVPPITLSCAYIFIVKDIFESTKPSYKKSLIPLAFLIAFIGSLFMENLTLYNIALGILIIIYSVIKFKKLYWLHISYLLGSLVGAVVMFSNSAYGLIASSNDKYRSTAFDGNFIETILHHLKKIYSILFVNNVFILVIITALVVALVIKYIKTTDNKKQKNIVFISAIINIISLFVFITLNIYKNFKPVFLQSFHKFFTFKYIIFTLILYCISLLLINIFTIKDKSKRDILLLLYLSIPIIVVPLLVVNPIGPRCFWPPYMIIILYTCGILTYLLENTEIKKAVIKAISIILIIASIGTYVYLYNIYNTIHYYDIKRIEYINKQIENGEKSIKVVNIPDGDYVWMEDPYDKLWEYRFKKFYDIDSKIKFELIDADLFDKWIIEYDKENT